MSEPTSREEYEAKFKANQKITGLGLDVTMHVPCAFCAEPDMLVHRVVDTEQAYSAGAVCKFCGRGIRGIFTHDRGGVSLEIVQTVGAAPPVWLPAIRRDLTD